MNPFVGANRGNSSEMHKFNQDGEETMKNQNADVASPVIEVATRRISPPVDVAARRDGKPEEVTVTTSIVLGRGVRSPKYGKGFIQEIEDGVIKVRFWRHGYKTFHKPEGDYPFDLLDEVRIVKKQSAVERVLARETPTEKKNRARTCRHRENRHFCLKCEGLEDAEIEKWNRYRSTERRINPRGLSLNRYVPVKISSSDQILISKPENALPADEISNAYHCRHCGTITDARTTAARLVLCPHCNEALVPIPEPFQNCQFSAEIGNGARSTNYADAKPIQHAPHSEEAASARGLYTDPNSRFQKGGTGYLRIPLDAPRSTRADAPEWLDCRESFLRTLKKSR